MHSLDRERKINMGEKITLRIGKGYKDKNSYIPAWTQDVSAPDGFYPDYDPSRATKTRKKTEDVTIRLAGFGEHQVHISGSNFSLRGNPVLEFYNQHGLTSEDDEIVIEKLSDDDYIYRITPK